MLLVGVLLLLLLLLEGERVGLSMELLLGVELLLGGREVGVGGIGGGLGLRVLEVAVGRIRGRLVERGGRGRGWGEVRSVVMRDVVAFFPSTDGTLSHG